MNKCRQRENKVKNYPDEVNRQADSGQMRVQNISQPCTEFHVHVPWCPREKCAQHHTQHKFLINLFTKSPLYANVGVLYDT